MSRGRRTLSTHARLSVTPFDGQATRIEYKRRGRTYYHTFKRSPRMYLAGEGNHLILAPVKVRAGQLHD